MIEDRVRFHLEERIKEQNSYNRRSLKEDIVPQCIDAIAKQLVDRYFEELE